MWGKQIKFKDCKLKKRDAVGSGHNSLTAVARQFGSLLCTYIRSLQFLIVGKELFFRISW